MKTPNPGVYGCPKNGQVGRCLDDKPCRQPHTHRVEVLVYPGDAVPKCPRHNVRLRWFRDL